TPLTLACFRLGAAFAASGQGACSGKLLATISSRDVRHRHFAFAGKIGCACDQLPYPCGDAHALRRRQRRNKAGRKHTIDYDMFGRTGVAVQKTRFGKRSESSSWKYLSPLLRVEPRGVTAIGIKDTLQLSNPLRAFVADVPNQPKNAASLQNPADLLESLGSGEPVK